MTTSHPLDQALRLEAAGSDLPGTWLGHTSPEYWNMVGPFGGTTAATALRAILLHPALLGEPVALTVNYAAALVEGPFTVTARPVRTNRSTQHWTVELSQADANGDAGVVMTATAVTAARRETWSQSDTPMPEATLPDAAARLKVSSVAWTHRYDMLPVRGIIPQVWDGSGVDSLTQLWVRDDPPRPLDFPALAALADVFYPRVWLRRATRVPAGTVSITTYFHADSQQLAQCGDAFCSARRGRRLFATASSTRPRSCGATPVCCWSRARRSSITRNETLVVSIGKHHEHTHPYFHRQHP